MSVKSVITALADQVRRLSGKTVSLSLETMTDALGAIVNNGTVSPSQLSAGESYTIPKGLHSGSGKVTAKSLSDQTDGTAAEGDILSGKTAYVDGVKVTGSMTDQGTKTASLDTTTTSYTIPAGKHSGSGKVSITTQEKSVTPSTSAQTVTPDSGKVLSEVIVGAVASATQATPEITVDSAGKITASATQEAGYVAAGTKSATKQMTTKGATTVTPTTSEQTIVDAGTYVTGAIKVAASTGKTVYKGSATYSGRYSPITLNVGRTIQDGDDVYVIVDGGYIGPFCLCAARISGNKYGITTDGYRTLYKVSENPDTFSVSGSWIELYGQSMSTITGMATSITCYWVIIR